MLALLIALLPLISGCVQRLHVSADQRCALRYNSIETRNYQTKAYLSEKNRGHSWKSFECQKPTNSYEKCLLYKYRISGYEREKFNRWYDKHNDLRLILDGLLIPWPFVEGYYKYKKNKAEKKSSLAMLRQCTSIKQK